MTIVVDYTKKYRLKDGVLSPSDDVGGRYAYYRVTDGISEPYMFYKGTVLQSNAAAFGVICRCKPGAEEGCFVVVKNKCYTVNSARLEDPNRFSYHRANSNDSVDSLKTWSPTQRCSDSSCSEYSTTDRPSSRVSNNCSGRRDFSSILRQQKLDGTGKGFNPFF